MERGATGTFPQNTFIYILTESLLCAEIVKVAAEDKFHEVKTTAATCVSLFCQLEPDFLRTSWAVLAPPLCKSLR
jgi:hypothetical protein